MDVIIHILVGFVGFFLTFAVACGGNKRDKDKEEDFRDIDYM